MLKSVSHETLSLYFDVIKVQHCYGIKNELSKLSNFVFVI
jgi:hypothetical protein